jgi:hypothetical protein
MTISDPREQIDKSDLLNETKRVDFFICTNESEVMSNGRNQTFAYVVPEVGGVKDLRIYTREEGALEMPQPRE